jgi:hypothetical protein
MSSAVCLACVLALVAACGGSVAVQPMAEAGAPDASPVDATSEPPVIDTGADVADEANLAPCGCPSVDYCVLWLAPDAAAPAGGNHLPDASAVWSTCATGSVSTICDGGPPLSVGYDVYGNQVSWAACVAP